MQRTFDRLRTGFLVLFLLLTSAVAVHQLYVIRPERQCMRGGGWWDRDQRVCATPLDITRLTRRPRGEARGSSPGEAPGQPSGLTTAPASPPAATERP